MSGGPDGLTYVRAVRDGRRPGDPLMEHLGIRVVSAEPGRVVMEVTPGPVRVDVRDAADRLVATGETTHAVVSIAPWQPSR